MSGEKHTPLPWTADGLYVTAEGGKPVIADCGRSPLVGFSDKRANVTLIVRSVNAVPALMAALDQIKGVCEDNSHERANKKMALDFVRQVATAALAAHQKES